MKQLKILITSPGVATAANIFFALKDAKFANLITILSAGNDDNCALAHLTSHFHKLPSINAASYVDELINLCVSESIDCLFPVHSTEIEKIAQRAQDFWKNYILVVAADYENISRFNDKVTFSRYCNKHNLPTIKTYEFSKSLKFPIYVKPKSGSSSKGHFVANSYNELISNLDPETLKEKYILQEVIDAPEITVDAYSSFIDSTVTCLPRLRLRVQDGKATSCKAFYDEELIALCTHILQTSNYRGPCNLQFFKTETGYKLIEINPRMSAGGLPLTVKCGLNIPEIALYELSTGSKSVNSDIRYNLTMHRYLTEVFV